MTSELRNVHEAHASTPDAVLGVREQDLPVKVREYARNIHTQILDIYARLGVTTASEIALLPRETLFASTAEIVQLQKLIPLLHEALADSDRTEHRIDDQKNLAWYETVAQRLAERAEQAGLLFAEDKTATFENILGRLRYDHAIQRDDDEDARDAAHEEMVESLTRAYKHILNGQSSAMRRLVECAYDVGEVGFAALRAQDHELEDDAGVLVKRAKAFARAGNTFVAVAALQECYDELVGNDNTRSAMLHDVGPVVYAAAVKADDAELAGNVMSLVATVCDVRAVYHDALTILIDAQDFSAATRLVQWSGVPDCWRDLLEARYDAGEDVKTDMTEYFNAGIAQFESDAFVGLEMSAFAVDRLRADPEAMQRCYTQLVAASAAREHDGAPYIRYRAQTLGELAVRIGQDPAPYLADLAALYTSTPAAFTSYDVGDYATLLYNTGNSEGARVMVDAVPPFGSRREVARAYLIRAMVRKGDVVDVPAQLDMVDEDLGRESGPSGIEGSDAADARYLCILHSIAIGDQKRADTFLRATSDQQLVNHAEKLLRLLSAAGMSRKPVMEAMENVIFGEGGRDAKLLCKYIQLSSATKVYGIDTIDYVTNIDHANLHLDTSVKKAKVVEWLWEGAVRAAEQAKRLKKVKGI